MEEARECPTKPECPMCGGALGHSGRGLWICENCPREDVGPPPDDDDDESDEDG
jgi:ribosomal protein L37AE/L43A